MNLSASHENYRANLRNFIASQTTQDLKRWTTRESSRSATGIDTTYSRVLANRAIHITVFRPTHPSTGTQHSVELTAPKVVIKNMHEETIAKFCDAEVTELVRPLTMLLVETIERKQKEIDVAKYNLFVSHPSLIATRKFGTLEAAAKYNYSAPILGYAATLGEVTFEAFKIGRGVSFYHANVVHSPGMNAASIEQRYPKSEAVLVFRKLNSIFKERNLAQAA